ncbi:LacI family DNA-binding transcriptional regulator [Microbacterium sp. Root553]|uniref:LacI family DNA-binding transcriptional regulator n=1 Tax=Microbacterium sp. Root553 TaxID=1736556 RepID=UPI0009EAE381|nr:LacI family DNA-binding transcriptional regulator [Microbacterium sp. Root553]
MAPTTALRGHPRVTLADVGRRAGCSAAAVSLWVNGKSDGRLTAENVERIAKAVEELGYVPNRAAQKLALGSSQSVSFLFPGALYGDFIASVVDGVSSHLGPDWEVAFVDAKPSAGGGGVSPLERALRSNPSGLVVSAPSQQLLDGLERVAVPTVVIDAPNAPAHTSLVSMALEPSIADLAAHLASLGHDTVAYVSFVAESLSLASRRTQVSGHLAALGIRMVPDDLLLSTLRVSDTLDAFTEVWPSWSASGVTAVICADDRHAYGVIAGARALGVDIPGDLSLVGFNDLDPNIVIDPPLAAISLPASQMGERGGDALAEHIRSGEPARIELATAYVPRASVGPRPPRS